MVKTESRRCARCGAPMDRRREDYICGPCLTLSRLGSLAPTAPPEMWRDAAMISAIARRDMGAVSRIHRAYTGSSQGDVAAIVDLTQPDISKIENNARVVTELELFIQFVNALGIPPQLTLQAIYGTQHPEGASTEPSLNPDDDGDDVLRRSLLLGSAFAAAAAVAPRTCSAAPSLKAPAVSAPLRSPRCNKWRFSSVTLTGASAGGVSGP